jgi:hypothetical protein
MYLRLHTPPTFYSEGALSGRSSAASTAAASTKRYVDAHGRAPSRSALTLVQEVGAMSTSETKEEDAMDDDRDQPEQEFGRQTLAEQAATEKILFGRPRTKSGRSVGLCAH